jgi:RHS repeat-associated protein
VSSAYSVVNYSYDVLGRRDSRIEGTNTEHYVYAGNQVSADLDGNGNVLRSYVWGAGIDNLLAITTYGVTETNTYCPLKDHLNTVYALVDDNGNVVESYEYDAWGKVLSMKDGSGKALSQSAIGNRYLWQGREYDAVTGLYYFRARWYDPVCGRWLSKDPIGISGGLNMYAFCGNNPVNFVDPMGLFRFGERPLEGMPQGSQTVVDIISPIGGLIQRGTNSKLVHEHGFFEDGSGENIGFGPNGRFNEDPSGKGYRLSGEHYNDALIREALKNVQDGNYSLLGWGPDPKNNCQDWADRLRAEYERLQKERKENGCK